MTIWEVVTGNSLLPIDVSNTFWDHLNNQNGGGGISQILHVEPVKEFYDETEVATVEFMDDDYDILHYEVESQVEVLSDDDSVQFFDDEVIAYVTP